jgi:hypothetical protein
MSSAFGGGIQHKFHDMPVFKQRLISLFLWCVATGILVIYSYVIYWYFDETLLGFIIMISILITDVFLYLFYNSNIVETATPLTIILLLNRLFLFVFGGDYWIYGLMVLYCIYSVILSIVICQKRFPFEDTIGDLNLDSI